MPRPYVTESGFIYPINVKNFRTQTIWQNHHRSKRNSCNAKINQHIVGHLIISIGEGKKYFVQENSLPAQTTAEINIATKFQTK